MKRTSSWEQHKGARGLREFIIIGGEFDAYDLLMENQFMEHDLAVYRSAQAAVTQPASNLQ